ncbi:hypothetical protein BKA65DRAFT_220489 [Rhexocercosporidium sp. MPI-PUGE-AT-0058]|nr:hypothetical protein BKA65DRAFT_220489 [Rhexocercosporidium sp. MPI-PUGE-AT-0058]
MNISANILNTIQANLTISKKLFELGENTGAAGIEATQWGVEISLVSSTLDQTRSTITEGKGCRYLIGAAVIVQMILERCQQIYHQLGTTLDRIELQDGRTEDLAAKVRCEFDRSEVKIMKGTLEACKIALHLIQHNLAVSRKAGGRRHSSFSINIQDQQQDLVIQALHNSRQTVIAGLERLENGNTYLNYQSSTRSSNKLRKSKPPNRKDVTSDLAVQKERASDWVKHLVRLEKNNSLISLEFSPEVTRDDEEILGRKLDGEIEGLREGIWELQGDGPEDLLRGSERMEYTRGWPSI